MAKRTSTKMSKHLRHTLLRAALYSAPLIVIAACAGIAHALATENPGLFAVTLAAFILSPLLLLILPDKVRYNPLCYREQSKPVFDRNAASFSPERRFAILVAGTLVLLGVGTLMLQLPSSVQWAIACLGFGPVAVLYIVRKVFGGDFIWSSMAKSRIPHQWEPSDGGIGLDPDD